MQMNFNDYDPNYDPNTKMGIVEAFCWFCILPTLVLACVITAIVKF